MDFARYWQSVAAQEKEPLRAYFTPDAAVCWPCTGERFRLEDFLRANCEYPGTWRAALERVIETEDGAVTVARVFSPETGVSCHVTSFFSLRDGKIASLTEYYADDGPAPEWRREMFGEPGALPACGRKGEDRGLG